MIQIKEDNLNYSFVLAQTILEDIKAKITPVSEMSKIDEQYAHLWQDISTWDASLKRKISSFYTDMIANNFDSIIAIKDNMPSFSICLNVCAKECLTFDFNKKMESFIKKYPEEAIALAKEQLLFYASAMIDFSKSTAINNLRDFYPDIFAKAFKELKEEIKYGDKNFLTHQNHYKKQVKKKGLDSYDKDTKEILECALTRAKQDSIPFIRIYNKIRTPDKEKA